MRAVSNSRVLRIALAASLAVHFIVAAVLHAPPVTAAPEQLPKRIYILRLPAPTPTPVPRVPTPKPAKSRAVQHRRAAAFRPVRPVHVAGVVRGGQRPALLPPSTGGAQPAATDAPGDAAAPAPPIPTPSPKPACSAPDVEAKAIIVQPAIVPDDVQTNGFTGTAEVRVDLDAAGAVIRTGIYESTGSMELDRAAEQAAAQSRYQPEQRDCKNVPGSYLFTVDFQ